jgi:hypothetical protein
MWLSLPQGVNPDKTIELQVVDLSKKTEGAGRTLNSKRDLIRGEVSRSEVNGKC